MAGMLRVPRTRTALSAGVLLILLGAWGLAGISGAWFAVGSVVGPAWSGMALVAGAPVGAPVTRAVEQIGLFTGLGVAIVWVAVLALRRFSVTGAWDARAPAEPAPDTA